MTEELFEPAVEFANMLATYLTELSQQYFWDYLENMEESSAEQTRT